MVHVRFANRELRLEKIHKLIVEKQQVSIDEISRLCPEVSVMTIHRDLNELERDGHIVKIYGGARLVSAKSEGSFSYREMENSEAKEIIAKKVAEVLRPGISVFIDAGTTTQMVAKKMPDIDIHVFTVAPTIALELVNVAKPSVTLCAGSLDKDYLMLTGYFTLDMLNRINIDVALMATSGFSLECGFTCGVESQMTVKRFALQKAKTRCLLMDYSKFNKILPYTFGGLSDIDYLITDKTPPDEIVSAAEQNNVIII